MITAVILGIAAIYVLVAGTHRVRRTPTYEQARPPKLGGDGASTGEQQERSHQTHADQKPLEPPKVDVVDIGDYTKVDPIKSDDGLPQGGFLTPMDAHPGFDPLEHVNADATPAERAAAATYTANAVAGTGEAIVQSMGQALSALYRSP